MKKVLSLLVIFAMLFSLASCGGSAEKETTGQKAQSASQESQPAGAGSKSLVAYFSCTGNTKAVAEKIADLTGAELYEIVPETPYTDEDLDYNNDDCRANKEMNDPSARPVIGSDPIDTAAYDTIYIGFPIWWGTMPRIIDTFLDTYDLSGKTVMPFCTSGGSGISQAVESMKQAEPDAIIKEGLQASGPDDSELTTWLGN
ncbi:MAG: flavodoxin [Firmicutes bacterium]|nr:flavodoxin [Bacillota bacterium]NBI64276.1 flavodoxin [Clostridiales bacterium]